MQKAPELTSNDLINFGFFESEEKLPSEIDGLILLASDIVMYEVGRNFNPTSEAHVLAVKKAISSQIKYWDDTGTSPVGAPAASSYSLGELSVSMSEPGSSTIKTSRSGLLCASAIMYLNDAFLLYRGLRHGKK